MRLEQPRALGLARFNAGRHRVDVFRQDHRKARCMGRGEATLEWTDFRDSLWDEPGETHNACLLPLQRERHDGPGGVVRLSSIVSALSYALDITEGQPEGHAARTCMIGMRIAEEYGLDDEQRSALFYGLLLKDLGCSSNAAKVASLFGADDLKTKRDFKTTDWPRLTQSMSYILRNIAPGGTLVQKAGRFLAIGVSGQRGAREMIQIRCERGAEIARLFGLAEETAQTIRSLDEHWNGRGHPLGLRGTDIPLLSRIAGLAQTVEVFAAVHGVDAAMAMAQQRSGRWFDPELVRIIQALRHDADLWEAWHDIDAYQRVTRFEPQDRCMLADDDRLDRLALGFARVVDAKSPWTARHSEAVASLATGAATVMGMDKETLTTLRRAALLHDIGKLGVSSQILDKPGRLTDDERAAMQRHPGYSERILQRIDGFEKITALASAHHERLDGKGYHRGLTARYLSKPMRCLVAADICEALSADRPYRETMPMSKVMSILEEQVGDGICPEAFRSLRYHVEVTGFRAAATATASAGAAEAA
jgi:putative nucleotidyltransferase with HDIG domain